MVDARAISQALALIIQANHSSEIIFPFGFSEKEIDILKGQVKKHNRHLIRRLGIEPIRLEDGPGTLFVLGNKN